LHLHSPVVLIVYCNVSEAVVCGQTVVHGGLSGGQHAVSEEKEFKKFCQILNK
jgi:hypothetical protein